MEAVETVVGRAIAAMQAGWKAGDGQAFAAPYGERAHYVTFDGQRLEGREAIAAFHQQVFDTFLKGTVLRLEVQEVRPVGDGVWVVFATGGIGREDGAAVERTGDSAQLFVCRADGDGVVVEAFQNTRVRPITDAVSAGVWREFDARWEGRNG